MNNVDNMQADVLLAVQAFADHAHGEQRRRYSGERYITHPVRVMETCSVYTTSTDVLCAALLHDVLEDTPVPASAIHDFLCKILPEENVIKILQLVVELTDIYTHANYPALNRRTRKKHEVARLARVSADAQMIKCADIIDNATNIFIHDPDFAHVYLQEGKTLLAKMNKGPAVLYVRAVKTVADCLDLLESKEEEISVISNPIKKPAN